MLSGLSISDVILSSHSDVEPESIIWEENALEMTRFHMRIFSFFWNQIHSLESAPNGSIFALINPFTLFVIKNECLSLEIILFDLESGIGSRTFGIVTSLECIQPGGGRVIDRLTALKATRYDSGSVYSIVLPAYSPTWYSVWTQESRGAS